MRALLLFFLVGAGCSADPVFVSVLVPSDTLDTVGPYRFEALVDAPRKTWSVELRWIRDDDLEDFAEFSFVQEDAEEDRWVLELDGQPPGSTIRFYLVAFDRALAEVRYPALEKQDTLEFSILE